ncbi:hypothetical protein K443DRAFT_279025 [Laccaria amethystina LaAM-08-1]|uniref:Uncharacterized protein n=1 Tax=Laccaria amethystina LaAM-08-1 TaxID=1095629 RepID=A0A0C9X2P0_9AGAR|nr:hypothetical protein K443DRAFT_279025 [Laccaria amethystina LaAM-08-1]
MSCLEQSLLCTPAPSFSVHRPYFSILPHIQLTKILLRGGLGKIRLSRRFSLTSQGRCVHLPRCLPLSRESTPSESTTPYPDKSPTILKPHPALAHQPAPSRMAVLQHIYGFDPVLWTSLASLAQAQSTIY